MDRQTKQCKVNVQNHTIEKWEVEYTVHHLNNHTFDLFEEASSSHHCLIYSYKPPTLWIVFKLDHKLQPFRCQNQNSKLLHKYKLKEM